MICIYIYINVHIALLTDDLFPKQPLFSHLVDGPFAHQAVDHVGSAALAQ